MLAQEFSLLKQVIFCCLGDRDYIENHINSFKKAILLIDPKIIIDVINRTHLSGSFNRILSYIDDPENSYKEIQGLIQYQTLFNITLKNELNIIAESLQQSSFRATILKGPSLWETIYFEEDYIRRIHDLDILVQKPEQMKNFIKIIQQLGYICDDEDPEQYIYDPEEYELPTYSRSIKTIVPINMFEPISTLCKSADTTLKLKLIGNNECEIRVDIEPHKSLFSYSGDVPEIQNSMLSPSNIFKSMDILNHPTQLAYLSGKIVIDAGFALDEDRDTTKFKCLKMLLDVIRILSQSNREIISTSFEQAKYLKSTSYFSEILSFVAESNLIANFNKQLFEIDKATGQNIIHTLLNKVIKNSLDLTVH